jgi:MFS family permease
LASLRAFSDQTFSSLKVRNYRLYFIGQGLSQTGTLMQSIAQDLLVLKLTGSGVDLGIIVALQALPVLVLGPLGGVVADRFPKRRVLYGTQATAGLLALILGLLVVANVAQVWMVGTLAFGLGVVRLLDNPTRQSFVMEMVGRDHLQNAISLNSTLMSLARVIGPTFAGVMVALVGLAGCFLVNAASYLLIVAALFLMREDELYPAPRSLRMRGQMSAGIAYVKSNHPVLISLLMMAIIGTFTYEFSVVLPLMATKVFDGGATAYAAMNAAMGVGAVVGGLVVASQARTSVKLLALTAVGFGIADLVTAVAPTLLVAMVTLLVVGFLSVSFTSRGNSTIQLLSAPEMRGRVMAFWMMAFLGTTPIGGPIVGWIGEHLGARTAMGLGGGAAIVAGLLGMLALNWLTARNGREPGGQGKPRPPLGTPVRASK